MLCSLTSEPYHSVVVGLLKMAVLEIHNITYRTSEFALTELEHYVACNILWCPLNLNCLNCAVTRPGSTDHTLQVCNSLMILLVIWKRFNLKLDFPAKEGRMILVFDAVFKELLWLSADLIGLGHSFITAVSSYLFLCSSARIFCLFKFLKWNRGFD